MPLHRPISTRPAQSRHGGVSRHLVSLLAGGLLALVLLVGWSCRTTRTGLMPIQRGAGSIEISSVEGIGTRAEPMLRVRIARQLARATLDGRGPWLVAAEGSSSGELLAGPVGIEASGGGIRLIDVYGRVSGFGPGTVVYAGPVVGPTDRSGKEIVGFDGMRYPGTLRLHPRGDLADTVFDVVNVVEIERYIPGVISKELVPHWDETTFMAQAVAARTFALTRREAARARGKWYDINNSQIDQVYGGLTGMRVAVRATEATRGVVLTDAGRLAEAFYSSTCGGKPALADEIWPTADPAIHTVSFGDDDFELTSAEREVLCQMSPLYEWDVARRTRDLGERIRKWGKRHDHEAGKLGTLARVEVTKRSPNGRSLVVEMTDSSGLVVTMTSERFRAACNSSQQGLPDISKVAQIFSGDVAVDVGRRVTRLSGHGYGHGVGMCQYCAQAMAKRGDDWRVLMTVFYPESQLLRIY